MKRILGAVLSTIVAGASSAVAQEAPHYFPITREGVIAAMGARGLSTDDAVVTLPAPIEATVQDPVIDLVSVTSTGDHSSQLLLACRNHQQCRSFYAAVRWSGKGPVTTLSPVSPALHAQARQPEGPAADTALKSGARTTLELDGERIHIRLEVICLEAGAIGDTIRVSTPNRRQTFSAQIIDPGLTKARM